MNNILTLVKINFLTALRSRVGKKHKMKTWMLGVIMLIWLGPMVFVISNVIISMYKIFDSFGQGDAIISIGLLTSSVVVFVFGIFYTIGSYYMSKDIPTYLYMPIKSWELTSSRFLIVLAYEYLTMVLFFMPVAIGYGIAAGMGVVYYVLAVIVFILLPILPLALASIIVMGIMSFAKKAMNKDRFTMIASILGMGIGLGFNFFFQGLVKSTDNSEGIKQLMETGKISVAESISRNFPGVANASKALTELNILHLLIFIVIAVLSFAVFILVAKALYFKGVIGINQQIARRKFDGGTSKTFESKAPVVTYLKKELNLIFRTPIFFMNLALIDFLMPLMLIVPMFISVGSDEIIQIKKMLEGNIPEGILIAGAFIVFVFMSAMNGITATTISREGKQFQIMKFIPMSYKAQLDAKLLSGMVISMTGMVLTLLFLVIFFKISVSVALLMFFAAANGVILTRLSGLFIDASNPKLKWDNEVKAVKQNVNLMFNMLIGIGAGAIAVVFLAVVTQSTLINILVFIPVMLAINFAIYKLLVNRFPKMMEQVE